MTHGNYRTVKLNKDGQEICQAIQESFERLERGLIGEQESLGRYQQLLVEHLELACFYAKKSVATDRRFAEGPPAILRRLVKVNESGLISTFQLDPPEESALHRAIPFVVRFVINGGVMDLMVQHGQTLKDVRAEVLLKSGNVGRALEHWEFRTQDGTVLPVDHVLVSSDERIYVSPLLGAGG